MLASTPASILNHKTAKNGIPSDSTKSGYALKNYWMDRHHITALWPESRRGNPNVKAFVGFLAELFPEPTPWDTAFVLA
ncbi:hypothetical protein IE4771_PB00043 (plasmid) [Rhizobium etli bv. mimosae str. IE4771]|uniref:Uncharacterized protein n=1 Tax=Rhizobium etli bv. mimosae str. IE4771 TaxID=1432050 RepID=A0A060I3Q0_RHIET|nr:hypothetical protein IE4771_PB00043 [Rhizobium sp. IE4771]